MKVQKAGVIGLGNIGPGHYRVYKELGLDVIGYDVEEKPGYNMAQKFDELSECDIVSICVPTNLHLEYGIRIGDLGVKNILMEKPYAKTVDECKILTEYFKKENIRATVGMIERYNPALNKVKELTRDEKILSMIFKRVGTKPGRIKDPISLDIGVHDFDLVKMISGNKLKDIRVLRKDDEEAMYYGKAGDANVIIELSWKAKDTKGRSLNLFTDKNVYYADYVNFRDPKILVRGKFDYTWENGDFVEFQNLSEDLKEIEFDKTEPLKNEISDIIQRIEEGEPFNISLEDATDAVRFATTY